MRIVFVMDSRFPDGDAFSSRARSFVKLFCDLGAHVHIIAKETKTKNSFEDLQGYDYSLEYVNQKESILSLLGIGYASPYIKALKSYIIDNRVDYIFSSNMIYAIDEIADIAYRISAPYIVEQCEWFDSSSFKYGKCNPYYRAHNRRVEKKNDNIDCIIAISRLLENHYHDRGINCIRIPTILDVQRTSFLIEKQEKTEYHIIFAGSIGNGKERMLPVIKSIIKYNTLNRKSRFILDIYGPTESQLIDNLGSEAELYYKNKRAIILHNRVPQSQLNEVLMNADYSIFIRPERRSSDAGFPTKLGESFAVATPVITNNTGDITLALKDGYNGFIVETDIEESLFHIFSKIENMDVNETVKMRNNARKTAEELFDYRNYTDIVYKMICKL